MQVSPVVSHNLRQRHQAFLKDVAAGHGNVSNFLRGERRALRGILRLNLIRGRGDLYLFPNLLFVVQDQRDFVAPRVQADGLARKHEEALLVNFRLIVAGRHIVNGKAAGQICFRSVGMTVGIFELYLCGHHRHAILVQNDASAIRRVRRLRFLRGKDPLYDQHPCQQPSKPHATPSPQASR